MNNKDFDFNKFTTEELRQYKDVNGKTVHDLLMEYNANYRDNFNKKQEDR